MNNMKQTQDDRTIQPFNRSTIQRVKAYAFTLAETLIVIGIIGVVAALTLPNLNHATGDKEKVTKVKKIYSALTDAVDRAQAIYGPFDEWFTDLDCENASQRQSCSERFAKRVTEFMKVSKDCGFNEGCFSDALMLELDGSNDDWYLLSDWLEQDYMVTLADGISLAFWKHGYSSKITVDIDGPNKGKNQWGNDIFDFAIHDNLYGGAKKNQLYPSDIPSAWTGDCFGRIQFKCYVTAWVVENGNLDYLKTTYDGGFKCSNGKLLNWETNTSCN